MPWRNGAEFTPVVFSYHQANTNFIWINQNICGYLELFNVKVVLIFTFSNRLPDIMITLEVSFYIGDFQACLHRAVMPGDLHIPFSFSIF